MDVQILMGYGANAACAPVAIFENRESALAILVPILGEPTHKFKKGKELCWKCIYEEHDAVSDEKNRNMIIKAEKKWSTKMNKVFKEYYDGCGGCDLVLEPIRFGKLKHFVWDLD